VLILTYGCYLANPASSGEPDVSREHRQAGLFSATEAAELVMPAGYKRSIAAQYQRMAAGS